MILTVELNSEQDRRTLNNVLRKVRSPGDLNWSLSTQSAYTYPHERTLDRDENQAFKIFVGLTAAGLTARIE